MSRELCDLFALKVDELSADFTPQVVAVQHFLGLCYTDIFVAGGGALVDRILVQDTVVNHTVKLPVDRRNADGMPEGTKFGMDLVYCQVLARHSLHILQDHFVIFGFVVSAGAQIQTSVQR